MTVSKINKNRQGTYDLYVDNIRICTKATIKEVQAIETKYLERRKREREAKQKQQQQKLVLK